MRKKGFTLIELLAVIVILAIISLIATPIVLNTINSSRDKTLETSIRNYIRAVENNLLVRDMGDKMVASGTYQIMSNGNICLSGTVTACTNIFQVDVDNTYPTSGSITIQNNKVVGLSNVTLNGVTISMSNNKDIVISESSKPCELISGDLETYGSVVTCGTESFNVMPDHQDATSNTISMLAKYNLNVGEDIYPATEGIQNENALGDKAGYDTYATTFFSNTYLNWQHDNYPVFVYNSEISISSYVEGYEKHLKNNLGVTTADATLVSYNQLFGENGLGCTYDSSCENAPEWVYSTTYWTGIAYSEHEVIYVYSDGSTSYDEHDEAASGGTYGVRPVVIVNKSEIDI